jgi:hypothetical protein
LTAGFVFACWAKYYTQVDAGAVRIEDVARTMGILFCSVDMKFAWCSDISFNCSLLEIIMFIMSPSPSKTMLYLMMLCSNNTIMTPTPF